MSEYCARELLCRCFCNLFLPNRGEPHQYSSVRKPVQLACTTVSAVFSTVCNVSLNLVGAQKQRGPEKLGKFSGEIFTSIRALRVVGCFWKSVVLYRDDDGITCACMF